MVSPGRGDLRTLTPTARCPPLPFSPASPPRVVSLGNETNPAQPSVSAKTALCPAPSLPVPRVPSLLRGAGEPQVLAQPRGPRLPQGHPAPWGHVGGAALPGGGRVPPGKAGDTGRAGLGDVPECYQPIVSPAAGAQPSGRTGQGHKGLSPPCPGHRWPSGRDPGVGSMGRLLSPGTCLLLLLLLAPLAAAASGESLKGAVRDGDGTGGRGRLWVPARPCLCSCLQTPRRPRATGMKGPGGGWRRPWLCSQLPGEPKTSSSSWVTVSARGWGAAGRAPSLECSSFPSVTSFPSAVPGPGCPGPPRPLPEASSSEPWGW